MNMGTISNSVKNENHPTSPPWIENSTSEDIDWSRKKIFKNLFFISISVFLLLTGCLTILKLQSSINFENGLGAASLGVQAGMHMLVALFLVTYTIRGFGCKNAYLLGIFMITVYVASNFYPSWYTLMPSSIVLGTGFALFYCSFLTYVSTLSSYYFKLYGGDHSLVTSRFFGILFLAYQANGVLGGLIAYYVLRDRKDNDIIINAHNGTLTTSLVCGRHFCDYLVDPNASYFRATKEQIYLLCAILVAFTVASFLIVWFFLDGLKKDTTSRESLCESMSLLARRQRNVFHILLIPLTMYSGLQLGFVTSDFTKAFITCSSGIEYVNFVLITYASTDAISSLLLGQLVKFIGRIAVFLLATSIDLSIILTMLLWTPDQDSQYVLYIIAGLWGISDGVWQGQVKALYGSLFPNYKEPGFSLQGAWECLGFTLGYSYSSNICTKYTISILFTFLVLGSSCYLVAEYLLRKRGQA